MFDKSQISGVDENGCFKIKKKRISGVDKNGYFKIKTEDQTSDQSLNIERASEKVDVIPSRDLKHVTFDVEICGWNDEGFGSEYSGFTLDKEQAVGLAEYLASKYGFKLVKED